MKTASIEELNEHLSDYLELVKSGESVEICDGGKAVATLAPHRTIEELDDEGTTDAAPTDWTIEEIIDDLVARGIVRKGTGILPDDFLTRPLPKPAASVLEQLLEDRKLSR